MSLLGADIESAVKVVGSGTGTTFGTVTNIISNTVGAGILVLPMAFYQGGFIVGSLVLLIVCVSCAYSFYLLGKCCEKCERYTLDGVIEMSLGPRWAGIGAWLKAILCFLSLIAVSVTIGVFLQAGIKAVADLNDKVWYYTLIMTLLIMFPLSCLKNTESLKFTSTAGFVIVLYGIALVVARCIYTFGKGKETILELYKSTPGSTRKTLTEAFSWGPPGPWGFTCAVGVVNMMNTMTVTVDCHFNACNFYRELKFRSTRTHRRITILAFGLIAILNFTMAYAGYFAFGMLGQTGNLVTDQNGKTHVVPILKDLIPQSFLSEGNVGILAKSAWEYSGMILMLVWGLALSFSFPLYFSCLRGAVYEVCPRLSPKEDESDEPRKRCMVTLMGVLLICAVAVGLLLVAPDSGSKIVFNILELVSCTAGNTITYIHQCEM